MGGETTLQVITSPLQQWCRRLLYLTGTTTWFGKSHHTWVWCPIWAICFSWISYKFIMAPWRRYRGPFSLYFGRNIWSSSRNWVTVSPYIILSNAYTHLCGLNVCGDICLGSYGVCNWHIWKTVWWAAHLDGVIFLVFSAGWPWREQRPWGHRHQSNYAHDILGIKIDPEFLLFILQAEILVTLASWLPVGSPVDSKEEM